MRVMSETKYISLVDETGRKSTLAFGSRDSKEGYLRVLGVLAHNLQFKPATEGDADALADYATGGKHSTLLEASRRAAELLNNLHAKFTAWEIDEARKVLGVALGAAIPSKVDAVYIAGKLARGGGDMILTAQVTRWLENHVKALDEKYGHDYANDSVNGCAFALGVLESTVTEILNDPSSLCRFRREVESA